MNQRDEDEFREFVAGRMEVLRGLAYLTCGDWQAAEDAVSTALSKLYIHWSRASAPYTYARRIVIHAAIDETRRPWRRERSTSPELLDWPRPDRVDAADDHAHVRESSTTVPSSSGSGTETVRHAP